MGGIMAVVSLLLGSIVGFASALVAFLLMGVSALTALGLWSLIGAGATVLLIGLAFATQREPAFSLASENG